MRRHYLVAYDIAEPGRLRRLARVVEDFGDRVQLSLFACQLADRDVGTLREALLRVIKADEDSVMLVDLGPVAETGEAGPVMETLGIPPALTARKALVF